MLRGSVRISTANPAPVFAALGDQTRLWLVKNLSDGKARSIAKLSVDLNLTRQAVTKHLHVLERAGVVSNVRVGRESHFSYRPKQSPMQGPICRRFRPNGTMHYPGSGFTSNDDGATDTLFSSSAKKTVESRTSQLR